MPNSRHAARAEAVAGERADLTFVSLAEAIDASSAPIAGFCAEPGHTGVAG